MFTSVFFSGWPAELRPNLRRNEKVGEGHDTFFTEVDVPRHNHTLLKVEAGLFSP